MAWALVFGREVFVSKSELSLSLFWVFLACQVGTVSCVRLGELRVHHSQGQGQLPAALERELGCHALPFSPSQEHKNAGFRNNRVVKGPSPQAALQPLNEGCVSLSVVQLWDGGTFPGVCPALSQTVHESGNYQQRAFC